MLCLYVRLHASNTSCTAERIYLEFIIKLLNPYTFGYVDVGPKVCDCVRRNNVFSIIYRYVVNHSSCSLAIDFQPKTRNFQAANLLFIYSARVYLNQCLKRYDICYRPSTKDHNDQQYVALLSRIRKFEIKIFLIQKFEHLHQNC